MTVRAEANLRLEGKKIGNADLRAISKGCHGSLGYVSFRKCPDSAVFCFPDVKGKCVVWELSG